MLSSSTIPIAGLLILAMLWMASVSAGETERPYRTTEERAPCEDYEPLRKPMFGDLHVHTRYSFDSYVSSQRNDPWDAYRYAKGEAIILPDEDGEQKIEARLLRPLDFTGITDHGEFLGPINICTEDPGKLGYWWPHCVMTRSDSFWVQLIAANGWVTMGVVNESREKDTSFVCTLSDCDAAQAQTWQKIQQAAEEHYDRSSRCEFTTFVGYEYTDAPDHKNLHRNVIFRNENVTELPITTYETGSRNFPELWSRLRTECIEGEKGCDVMSIPHNSNLSGGLMFPDPASPEEASNRLFFEPLIELTQHKAASECRFDRLEGRGLDTEDELCDFEQAKADNLAMLGTVMGKVRTERAAPVPLDEFGRRNMARNALKDGLALEQTSGVNPFRFGFIGSTDTHSATPGGAEEDNYVGSLGRRDSGYRNVQDHFYDNPGGLAVVWAEENSRDSIFEGMRRREAYATSGTRPIVRFFAGWNYQPELCQSGDLIAEAYAGGVPMGAELPNESSSHGVAPSFLVTALQDAGSPGHPGTQLQRIQIIKGWLDADGKTRERVVDVAGNGANGASVDPDSCAATGAGHSQLCSVWQDPDFDPSQRAFYYARVIENPSCRWSTLHCQAAGVNPLSDRCEAQSAAVSAQVRERGGVGEVYENCCIDPAEEPFYTPTIQERAWTSPIWFSPTP